jgi:hypothetical protein
VAVLQRQIADLSTARDLAQSAPRNGVLSLIDVRDVNRRFLAASDERAWAGRPQPGVGRRLWCAGRWME